VGVAGTKGNSNNSLIVKGAASSTEDIEDEVVRADEKPDRMKEVMQANAV
jgi:hypothetical protein